MPRALVTGGAGFIGSHVADLYLEHGYDVTVLDNFASGRRENVPASARLAELDLTSAEARELVANGRFDVVSHLGAQIDVRKSVADPMYDASINVVGTLNLLEGVRASGHATRFIFSSTGGALYGDFVTPPNVEDFPKDPESPYGIAKLSAELYLAYYARVHKIDTVSLRYANVYGPRQDPHGEAGVVAIFCNRILTRQPLTVFGDGSQTRSFQYITDLIDGVWRLMQTATNDPVNIGNPQEMTLLALAERVIALTGSRSPIIFRPLPEDDPKVRQPDISRARAILGWEPRVDTDEGLRRTLQWFRDKIHG